MSEAKMMGAMCKRLLEMLSEEKTETQMDKLIDYLKNKGLPQVIETSRKYARLGNNPLMTDLGKCEARMIVAIIQRKSKDEVMEIYEVCKAAVGKLTEIYDTHSEKMPSYDYVLWLNMNKIYFDEIEWLKKEYLSCC
jgi:hypothetical protein